MVLAVTKALVSLHGGKISAFSEGEGQGCTFTVELPVFEGFGDGHRDSKLEHEDSNFSLFVTEPLDINVLLVDDSSMNRKMSRRSMSELARRIDEAEDGAVALEKVLTTRTDNPYDVIFMDYQMPVMDGPTAAKEMRRLGYKGKIIGLTGNAQPEDIAVFVGHGADQVLTKPVPQTAITAILRGQ